MTKVLIIGGGVYGLSTALSLAKGRYKQTPEKILVVDRSATPPEKDAACSDINKIVRGDYCDGTYAELAQRCLDKWQNDPDWKPYFYQSGIVVAASTLGAHGETYVRKSFDEQKKLFESGRSKVPPLLVEDQSSFAAALDVSTSSSKSTESIAIGEAPPLAYCNRNSGWGAASDAMESLYQRCKTAGVSFKQAQINSLIVQDGDVKGARAEDGTEFRAEKLTILCAGSWSPAIFPELKDHVVATGQVLATIQLSREEAERYSRTPVYIDMQTGYYMFPPNKDNIIKIALHLRGYSNEQPSLSDPSTTSLSLPRTGHFHGTLDEHIPIESIHSLRKGLKRIYPELAAEKEWSGTRMCWYADSRDCDWHIDYHDRYPSLFLATGDSGHAFKFLPIMGELVTSAIDRTLPPHLRHAWSYTRTREEYKPDRGDSLLTPLNLDTLARPEDLLPQSQ